MTYLSPTALRNLKPYVYEVVDESLASYHILDPYWNWFLALWPQTVASNTSLNILTLLIYDPLYYTDKDGPTNPPQWIYFTWALGLFMYQTFDGVDGTLAGLARLVHLVNCLIMVAMPFIPRWKLFWHAEPLISVVRGGLSCPKSNEGALLIVLIYIITGTFGPSFWDQRFLTFAHLDHIPQVVENVPNIRLNEAFILFAASLLSFDVASSYQNVYKAMRATGRSHLKPLVFILPFVLSAVLQVLWLLRPSIHHSNIIYSSLFLPVMGAWGLQFAHHAARVILSRVTKTPFPWWNPVWIWSAIGVLDAHLPELLRRSPIIQSTPERTAMFVYLTLAISFFAYARFYIPVTREITEYLGIEYFTLRKHA